MGVAISGWRLAAAVGSLSGCLGVVSGTAIDTVLARRLQDGDRGGDLREAMAGFPDREVVGRVLDRFYLPDGRRPGASLPPRRDAHPRGAPAAPRPDRPRRLRRGQPGPAGSCRTDRHQPAHQGEGADPPDPVRRHVGQGGLRPHGCGDPSRDPRRSRRLRRGPRGDHAASGRPPGRRARARAVVRPGPGALRRCRSPPPGVPRHRVRGIAGRHAGATLQRAGRRLRRRGPIGGGHNAPPRGQSGPGRERPARIRPARSRRRGPDEGVGTSVLASRRHRLPRGPRRGLGRRRQRNPGGHPLRVFTRVPAWSPGFATR